MWQVCGLKQKRGRQGKGRALILNRIHLIVGDKTPIQTGLKTKKRGLSSTGSYNCRVIVRSSTQIISSTICLPQCLAFAPLGTGHPSSARLSPWMGRAPSSYQVSGHWEWWRNESTKAGWGCLYFKRVGYMQGKQKHQIPSPLPLLEEACQAGEHSFSSSLTDALSLGPPSPTWSQGGVESFWLPTVLFLPSYLKGGSWRTLSSAEEAYPQLEILLSVAPKMFSSNRHLKHFTEAAPYIFNETLKRHLVRNKGEINQK